MDASWVPKAGPVRETGGTIFFNPMPLPPQVEGSVPFPPSVGSIGSNLEFEQGQIDFDIERKTAGDIAQVVLKGKYGPIHVGFGGIQTPFIIAAMNPQGALPIIASAGTGSAYHLELKHRVRVIVKGSQISLAINGVMVATAYAETAQGGIEFFFNGYNSTEVTNVKILSKKPICFVVMQFSSQFDDVYHHVIKPTCQRFNYEVIRADESYTNGSILSEIIQTIKECSLIIADITPDNPNVYYELGYAHGIGKQTILLCESSRAKLPFDLASFRTLFYKDSIGGNAAIQARLERHLQEIANPSQRIGG